MIDLKISSDFAAMCLCKKKKKTTPYNDKQP